MALNMQQKITIAACAITYDNDREAVRRARYDFNLSLQPSTLAKWRKRHTEKELKKIQAIPINMYISNSKCKLQMSPHAKTTAQQEWCIVRREYMFRASFRRSSFAVLVICASQSASEMTRQLKTYSKGDVRGTIRFLWAKRLNCTYSPWNSGSV